MILLIMLYFVETMKFNFKRFTFAVKFICNICRSISDNDLQV